MHDTKVLTRTSTGSGRAREVYEQLRKAIVTGKLRPNEPLIEVVIAGRLQVSRTPVREVMQRLAADGLITPRRRGWAVREFTAEEACHSSDVRAALEGYAAALAAQRAEESDLQHIATIHKSRLVLRAVDEEERDRTNRAFHDAIIGAARNPRLTDAIFRSGQFYFNGPVARGSTDVELRAGNKDHDVIVRHLVRRNAAGAEAAMRRHLYRTFTAYKPGRAE